MRTLAKSILTLVALLTPAWAGPLPAPTLQPGKFVYTIPPEWSPPGFSQAGIDEMSEVARSLKYPFYVVLVHDLPGQLGSSQDQDAVRAIDGLAEDLSRQNGYDMGKSSIFMLSFNPRKWRFLAGATWRQQLGFQREAHKPYTDNFVRAVQGTPKDPKGGIIATMRAVDSYLWDQTDPVKVAARQEAARKAALRRQVEVAETALDQEISRLQGMLRETEYLPPDTREYHVVLDQARAIRNNDDTAQMTAFSKTVQQANNKLSPIVESARSEAQAHAAAVAFEWGLSITAGLVALVLFIRRRRRYRDLKQAFEVEIERWETKVSNANSQYTAVYVDRDDVIGLEKAQGETGDLYKKVTDEVNDIFLCIKGLESHIASCRQLANKASFFNLDPLRQATAKIDSAFQFDTEKVNKDDLFGSETKVITVVPSSFAGEQAARFKKCQEDWDRLKTAAKMRGEPVELQLPIQHLHTTIKTANDAGIPERWHSDHPLHNEKDICAELNDKRYKDPIAVARKVQEHLAKAAVVAARVNKLAGYMDAVAKAKKDAAGLDASFLGKTTYAEADDPVVTVSRATGEEIRLGGLLSSVDISDIKPIEEATTKIRNLYIKASEQMGTLKSATVHAEAAIKNTEGEYAAAEKALDSAGTAIKRASLVHAEKGLAPALNRVEQGLKSLVTGGDFLDQAKKELSLKSHLNALRLADNAKNRFSAAQSDAREAMSICAGLDQKKQEFEKRAAQMEANRKEHERRIRNHGGGSVTLNVWTTPTIDRSVDYDLLLAQQYAHERAWQERVDQAARDAAERERARAEAEAAAEAARARRRSSYSDYSSSSGSSWSSSDSSSSGGDWGGGGGDSGSSGGDW